MTVDAAFHETEVDEEYDKVMLLCFRQRQFWSMVLNFALAHMQIPACRFDGASRQRTFDIVA